MTERAERIQRLLDDPDLKEAFQTVREKYRDLIEETPLSSKDDEAIHDIRKMLHLLREVESTLHQAIQDGHLEDFKREQEGQGLLQDLSKWKRRKIRL